MFVSLPRLADEPNLCGELSAILMGTHIGEISGELKEVVEMFEREYNNFKENEEVVKSMTILEERFVEGKVEGKIEGRVEGKIEGKIEGKAEGKVEGRIERDMEIALKMFSIKKDAARVTRSLRELGISDEVIKAAHEQQS